MSSNEFSFWLFLIFLCGSIIFFGISLGMGEIFFVFAWFVWSMICVTVLTHYYNEMECE